jgi:hypothetical protein
MLAIRDKNRRSRPYTRQADNRPPHRQTRCACAMPARGCHRAGLDCPQAQRVRQLCDVGAAGVIWSALLSRFLVANGQYR